MPSQAFLVAGGGIAGLAMARGLARSSHAVTVLEQAPVFEEIGAGLQLGPNAVKALKHLDAWEAIEGSTFAPPRIVIRDGHTGVVLQRIELGRDFESRFGEPYRVIHRADLLAGLLAAVQASSGIVLKPGKRLIGYERTELGVAAKTAGGEILRASALIGADGVHSAVREKLLGDGLARFAGQVLFRALVPLSRMPADLDYTAVSIWLCRGAHLVHYPVSAGKNLNIVAAANSSWNQEGWSAGADASQVRACFPSCHRSVDLILTAPKTWTSWAGAWRRPVRSWSEGRVTLIGDAAHPMLPFLAQGAAMALEDAAVLSTILSVDRDIPKAFENYESQRLARTARAVRMSCRQGYGYHASGPLRLARNVILRALSSDAILSRLAWLYGWRPLER
jgi:2-polyprenyl-6-methoxyphenol hydroxylase-like FAD-dependent oxidoreductase